jgi:hypothetical protein
MAPPVGMRSWASAREQAGFVRNSPGTTLRTWPKTPSKANEPMPGRGRGLVGEKLCSDPFPASIGDPTRRGPETE